MTGAREQLYELLALSSTEGVNSAEARRVEELTQRHPDVDAEEFERAAAALHLAMLGDERRMPSALEAKVIEAGERFVGGTDTELAARPRSARVAQLRASGWWAAAAVLALAVIGWWPQLQRTPRSEPREMTTARPSLDSLLREPATERLAWSATEDATAAGASGEVVWNNDRQAGYLRFTGLEANDPTEFQYQLWIFDRARDERYPIDGGVFDITAGAPEVIVPIEARIPVGEPYLFAITVEPPGGVVVSTRERIALVAQPS